MAHHNNPRIVTDGLILCLDSLNKKSLISNTWYNLCNSSNYTEGSFVTSNDVVAGTSLDFNNSLQRTIYFQSLLGTKMSFSFAVRSTGTPIADYRPFFRFGDLDGTTYFGAHSGTISSPYILIYCKDFSTTQYITSTVLNSSLYSEYKWHIYDVVVNETQWTVYRDGDSLGTNAITINIGSYKNINRVEFNVSGSGSFYMQSFRLYNRALTSTEVYQNYQAFCKRYGL